MPFKDPASVAALNSARSAQLKYNTSEKGRAKHKAWRDSPAGQESSRRAKARFKKRHPTYMRDWVRARRSTPTGRHRAAVLTLKTKYGLTDQQAAVALVSQQGDFCAACHKFTRLEVDHCHRTDRPRGMICGGCNRALGDVNDSILQLEACIAYLKSQPKDPAQ